MKTVKSVPDLITQPSGNRLNISSVQFTAEAQQTERVACHSILALGVTAFEDYVREFLTTFLMKTWKPDKAYKVSLCPQDIPAAAEINEWLKAKATQVVVNDYVSKAYSDRLQAVSQLIVTHNAQPPNIHKSMQDLSSQACEARNCIVHSSAIVDERAAKALASVVPGVKEGIKQLLFCKCRDEQAGHLAFMFR